MKSFTQKFSGLVGSLMPKEAGRVAYGAFVRHLEKKAQKKWGPKTKLWSKNSFQPKVFQSFVTPLEIGLFVPSRVSELEWSDFRSSLDGYRLYFPWLGTLDVYDLSSRALLDCANFFELERDPRLKDPLLIISRKPSKGEALVFLMKMIEGDWDNLVSRPLLRILVWQLHWKAISAHFEGFKDFEMKEVFNRILHFARVSAEERKNLVLFLNQKKPIENGQNSKALLMFFPKDFDGQSMDVLELKGLDAECLQLSIAWEIWHLWSQRGDFKTSEYRARIEKLLKIANTSYAITEPSLFQKTKQQAELFLASSEK